MPPDTAGKDARRYRTVAGPKRARQFPVQRFFWQKNLFGVETNCSLKGMSVGSFTIAVKRQGTR
jgi:hypothetical protein